MSFYKLGVKVGAGIAFVIGGILYDYWAGVGNISVPLIGEIKPWQMTLISVGAPGALLSLLLLTVNEPPRKDLVNKEGEGVPIKVVFRFMWQRKGVYIALFLGASMMAMAGYGTSAWYPEFFFRNYGMSKSEAGVTYGTIVLVAGSVGVMLGAWLARQLEERGYTDAYVRAIFLTSVVGAPLMSIAPLTHDPTWNVILLWPGVIIAGSYLGVLAVAMVVITPNEMRGQVTAIYLFVTNILGMAVGTSVLAAFTDFLFQDDALLHYSIATACGLFYPIAAVSFWFALAPYRRAVKDIGNWNLS